MIDKNLVPNDVMDILKRLQSEGFASFIVGGSVRDLILGKKPKDFDICTLAKPQEVKGMFNKVIDTGLKHGTITVLDGNTAVEVTTFRKTLEGKEGQGEIITGFGENEIEDVKARDFTINALLFDGEKVTDFVNGLDDLNHKIIRSVDMPDYRFQEDPLRMLRALRLSCQLGFEVEQSTFSSICTNASLIASVAQERTRDELIKILLCEVPSKGIKSMRETGLLKYVLPELQKCYKFDQQNPHHDKDVFDHIMSVLDHTHNNLILRLAALLHDIGKPETFSVDDKGVGHFYYHNIEGYKITKKVLSRLKFDNRTKDCVGVLVKEHMSKLKVIRRITIKKLINRVGRDNIHLLLQLQMADEAGSAPPHDFEILYRLKQEIDSILREKEPLSVKDLAINGSDLIELGFKPGPKLGKILGKLAEKVIVNPKLNTKEALMKILLKERV